MQWGCQDNTKTHKHDTKESRHSEMGPCSKTKPNPESCKNCSSECAYDCTTSVHNTAQNSSDKEVGWNIVAETTYGGYDGDPITGIHLHWHCNTPAIFLQRVRIAIAFLSVRLSVRPSGSSVLSRWMKIRSCDLSGSSIIVVSREVKIIGTFAGGASPARALKRGRRLSQAKIWPKMSHNLETV